MRTSPDASARFINIYYAVVAVMLYLAFANGALADTNITQLDSGWEYHQGSLGSVWEIWRGDKASDNVAWSHVMLPHCFNAFDAVDPDEHYYQGQGWYRTRLKLANPFPKGRTILHFDGAGQKAQVFVWLQKAGEHVGGYDQWDVDITDLAAQAVTNSFNKGAVPLSVMCDNGRDAESIPSDLSDFTKYGGLYRHVSLVYVPAVSLQRVHIEPTVNADGKASVKILSQFYNPGNATDTVGLTVRVTDPDGQVIQNLTIKDAPWEGMKNFANFEIASPKLWSPKSPALYTCTVMLNYAGGSQQLTEHFGLRSFEWVDHGPFKLNGTRLLLRGTHYHEDHAGVGGAVPDEVVRQTFRQMKEMGVNFVRLSHYQQAPLVLEQCDKLGILVWEEIPWCRGGIGGDRYKEQCRDMLHNMIDQHFNHPAVILWGLGNENGWPGDFEVFDTNAVRNFMIELNGLAHQYDPSRKTTIRYCNFCTDVTDVYSPSVWAGWYSGRYPEYRATLDREIKSVKHFFHAEWGGDSHARRFSEEPEKFLQDVATNHGTAETGTAYKRSGGSARAAKDGDWSESYIANLFDWHLREQERMTNLTGAAMWIFKDFATPLRPENPVPRVNQKGVVERDGTLKESYYIFQSYWTEKPMIHIFGHTWETRWGKPGQAREVKVFSNCRDAELFVNGASQGVKQRNQEDFPAAGLRWMVKFKPGVNKLRVVGHRDGVEVTDEMTQGYQTAAWSKPAKFTLKEIWRSADEATIEVRAFDQANVPCLDAANLVRFSLTGDGQLIDDLGTSTGSRAVQLYNGRAQISLHLKGRAVASVSSEGLPTEFVSLGGTSTTAKR